MGLLLDNTFAEILSVVGIILWVFYSYVTKYYNHWKDRGVPYIDGKFPLGTLSDVMLGQENIGEAFTQCYRMFKDEPYFGIMDGRKPTLVVNDLDLIKLILIKDFRHFTDRFSFSNNQKKDYISNHLFNMGGKDWRNMRVTLTPTFTSGKMKAMFYLLEKCCNQLEKYLESQIDPTGDIDVKDTLARFTMDTIATCAFGLDTNCLTDRNCNFFSMGNQILKPTIVRMIRRVWYSVVPIFAVLYAPPVVQEHIRKFFTELIGDTVSYREKNNINRNDFLDLLMKIRQNKSHLIEEEKKNGSEHFIDTESKQSYKKPELTLEEITAQSFVFFLAGFETSSSTASFCLYEMSRNQDIQDKLFNEIKEVLLKHGGKPTYQALQEMTYMDKVVNETLRLYPSLSILDRTCTETYQIPNSKLVLQKGAKVVIPIKAIHYDQRYFPEPYKFDPERFSPENVKLRHPFAFLPFGEGPRMCIGMRFGLMQTKVALTTMLYNYHFSIGPDTEIPIKINKTAVVTLPENPLILHMTKRKF